MAAKMKTTNMKIMAAKMAASMKIIENEAA